MPRRKRSYRALRREAEESDSTETDGTDYSGGLGTSAEESDTSTDTSRQSQDSRGRRTRVLEERGEQDDLDFDVEKGFRSRRTTRGSGRNYATDEAPDYGSLADNTGRERHATDDEESESTTTDGSSSEDAPPRKPDYRRRRAGGKNALATLIKYMILAVLLVLGLALGAGYFSYRRQKRSYEERQLKARIIQQAKNELDEYIIKEEQAVHAQKEREMLREEDDLAKEIKLLMDEEKRIEAGDEYERDRREHAREDALGKYKVYNQFLEPTLSAVKRGMSAKTRVALPERKVDEETREYESNERRMAAQRSGLREEALRVQERQDQALAQQKEQRFKEDMRKIRESKREREVNQPSPQPPPQQQQQQQQQQRIINRNWQQQQQQQTVNTNQQNQQRTSTPKKQNTGSQQKQQPRRKKGLSAKEERLKKIEVLRQRQSELRKARLEEGRLARSKTLLTKKQIKARRRDRELSAIVSRKMRDEKLKQMERAALLDSAERIGRQSARDVQSRERLAEEERRREAAEQRVIGALLRNVPKEEVEREEREEAERNKKLQQQYLAEKELQRQDQAPAEEQESDLFAFLKQARDGANKAAADGKAPAALSAPQPSKALADADVLEVNTEEHVQKRREKRVVSLEQGAKRRHSAPAQQESVPHIVQEDVPLSPESLKRLRSPK